MSAYLLLVVRTELSIALLFGIKFAFLGKSLASFDVQNPIIDLPKYREKEVFTAGLSLFRLRFLVGGAWGGGGWAGRRGLVSRRL